MPYKLKDPVRHKFSKKEYNKREWGSYEQGLCERGSITVWISEEAIAGWNVVQPEKRKPGRQRQYSDIAVETAWALRMVYNKQLRQTEGFIKSIFKLMEIDLKTPDHTTLSRRGRKLSLPKPSLPKKEGPIVVIIDSTGLKVVGEKEWMAYKHGTTVRKVWRKLHLGIDEEGHILSSTLTSHTDSDCGQVDPLFKQIDMPIKATIADGAYDSPCTYQALEEHRLRHHQEDLIQAIIPPNTGFQASKQTDPAQRLRNIHVIEDKGKNHWQALTGYGRRAKVENTMHRYKSIIGAKLRSKTFEGQVIETKIAVQILNRMVSLGMPRSQPSP